MSERLSVEAEQASGAHDVIVNDFQISVATINGTGSQTSNSAVIRALFRMGIPVSGKNIFPSNIKGLPTWFLIRVNKDGFVGRKETIEIMVAMNEATIVKDVQDLKPGSICLYDSGLTYHVSREDVTFYPIPVDDLVGQADVNPKLREYVRNMAYVGVLAYLLGIDRGKIEQALSYELKGKASAVKLNMDVVDLAYKYAQDNYKEPSPYRVEPMDLTQGMVLLDGNSAAALGAIFGGVHMIAWYPITPSSSVADNAMAFLKQYRTDPGTGKATYAIVQAEDELAAIGMIVGAGWAGARAMTATSGPGISLMTEFAGLAYFAEIPAVIWDVQRVGPSTGLPTRTSQGDLLSVYFLGHGDTRQIILLPGTLAEAFEFGWRAFDIAEHFQTLVFVLSDLDLGMNLWMSEPFQYPDQPMDRGKVLPDVDSLRAHIEKYGAFGRYKDVDGDGIPYRSIPGNPDWRSAYFARGTGHNEMAVYSEDPAVWERVNKRIWRKFEEARTALPQPIVDQRGASVGLIAFGTTDSPMQEARRKLEERGIHTDYLRVRALPLSPVVREFIEKHERVYVIENNQDGQLAGIIRIDYPDLASKAKSISHLDGMPLSATWIANSVMAEEG